MLQFIPFEDDWDALERMRPEDLVPYRVGLLPEPAPGMEARAAGAGAVSPHMQCSTASRPPRDSTGN